VQALVRAMFGEAASQSNANAADGAIPAAQRNPAGGAAWFVPRPTADALKQVFDQALPVPDVSWTESIVVTGGHLACLHKVVDGKDVWFFANSSDTPIRTTVMLRGEHRLERWDPHTGRIEACAATPDAGRTRLPLHLDPVSSIFFVTGSQP